MSLPERLWLLGSEEFFPAPECDRLGVSTLTFIVSFRCRHTIVSPCIVSPSKSKTQVCQEVDCCVVQRKIVD